MKNRYDAIIFDFDFTLADASEGIDHCLKYAYDKMKLEFVSPGLVKYTQGITLMELISEHTGSSDKEFLDNIYSHYFTEAKERMTDMTAFFEDTHDALKHLKDEKYKLGIVSNKYRFRIEEFLGRNNYDGYFDVIVGTEDVKEAKPSPEGLLLAIDKLEVPVSSTLFVGDNPTDSETALRAGTDFIGVSRYGHKHFENSDIEFLALIKSLEELKDHL